MIIFDYSLLIFHCQPLYIYKCAIGKGWGALHFKMEICRNDKKKKSNEHTPNREIFSSLDTMPR